MKYKFLRFFLLLFMTFSTTHGSQCRVEEIVKDSDCIKCESKIEEPSEFFEETIDSIVDFTTKSKQNKIILDKLMATEKFLSLENNMRNCSNYSSLKEGFIFDFQKNLKKCSEGPKILNNNKQICEWVFGKYSDSIEDNFYASYATIDKKGITREVPGARERLESPMRAHLRWCNDIKKVYDQKIYVNCSRTENNIAELDRSRKIHEAMERDLRSSANPPKPELTLEQQRQENLKEACKYFDNNPITTLSKDFFLQCI